MCGFSIIYFYKIIKEIILMLKKQIRTLPVLFTLGVVFFSFTIKTITDILKIDLYPNLSAIYQIVGTILGSLFIFIMAEGLRDAKEKYKVRVFFNKSKLATIIILFLISLTLLLFQENHIISFLISGTLICFILLSIYAVYQIISIILNSEKLWQGHIDLFKNRTQKVTKFIISVRLKNSKLSQLIKDTKNELYPWSVNKNSNDIILKSLKEGVVTDIDLRKIKTIFQKIHMAERNTSRLSIQAKRVLDNKIEEPSEELKPSTNLKRESQAECIFRITIGQEIKRGTHLLSYDSNIQIDRINNLQRKLNDTITVKKLTVADEVQAELEDFKSMIITSIKENNVYQFERYFELYLKLAEEFLEHVKYPYQGARREINSLPLGKFEGWPPLKWLREHIIEFFNQAVKIRSSKDLKFSEIYLKIQFFTYNLISLSQEKDDHLLFQESLILWRRQLSALSNKDHVKDHVKFFKEYIIYSIFEKITENSHVLKEKEGYAAYLLEMTKSLFEYILRKDQYCLLDIFEEIIEAIAVNGHSAYTTRDLSFLNFDNIDQNVFEKFDSYESRKLQFLFGLGAFLNGLEDTENKLIGIKDTIKKCMPGLKSLKSYIKMYPLVVNIEVNKFWDWSFFNTSVGQTTARPLYSESHIKFYFLQIMSEIQKKEFEYLKISDLDIKALCSMEYTYFNISDDILNELFNKSRIIDHDKKERIRSFFTEVSKYLGERRAEYVSKSELNKGKIRKFTQTFREDFIKKSYMRWLFKQSNKTQCTSNKYENMIFGMNYVENKANFISSNDIVSNMISSNIDNLSTWFSGGFAKTENNFLQSEILNKCKKIEVSYNEFTEKLLNRRWQDNEVLLFNNNIYQKILMNRLFFDNVAHFDSQNDNFFHSYFKYKNKKVPLRSCYMYNKNNAAIILDSTKLPMLEMFNSIEKEKELFSFQPIEDIGIGVGISAFSHNKKLIDSMISESPDWLNKKVKGRENQIIYLNQLVNIKILQGIHLNWTGIETPIGTSFSISKN